MVVFYFDIFGAANTSEIFCSPENVDPPQRDIYVFMSQGLKKRYELQVRSAIPYRGASGRQVRARVAVRAWLVDGLDAWSSVTSDPWRQVTTGTRH